MPRKARIVEKRFSRAGDHGRLVARAGAHNAEHPGAPLARIWTAGDPTPCAYLALPGTSYETAALAHEVAAQVLRGRPTLFSDWPQVARDRWVVAVRLPCHEEMRDDAAAALFDALVAATARRLDHRVEVRS